MLSSTVVIGLVGLVTSPLAIAMPASLKRQTPGSSGPVSLIAAHSGSAIQ